MCDANLSQWFTARLCHNVRALNLHTLLPETRLEGLPEVQRMVEQVSAFGAVTDEMSGYSHHLLSEESRGYFGFALLGHLYQYRVLPFGWNASCYFHQRNGMIVTGFYRYLGGRVCQYIDDHTLAPSPDKVRAEREVYAFYSLKSAFGYSLAPEKTSWQVARRFQTLGLVCDTQRQAWIVPAVKKEEYRKLGDVLIAQCDRQQLVPLTLSRFTGKTVYYKWAVPFIRRYQNVQYAVLTGRELVDEASVERDDRRWWENPSGGVRAMSAALRRSLTEEIRACVAFVVGDQIYPFVRERHVNMAVLRADYRLYTDTTLDRYGVYLVDLRNTADGGEEKLPRPEVILGNILPDTVAGVALAHCNTGVVELSGLCHALRIIDHDGRLRDEFENIHLDVMMDNLEDIRLLKTGRVGGAYTLQKQQILMEVWHYFWKWNVIPRFQHVASADNPADGPSRLRYRNEVRLRRSVFNMLWRDCGPFDVDCMASAGNVMCHPDTGAPLPFVSRSLDVGNRSVNVFATHWGQSGSDGTREQVYCNPPFVMTASVVSWMQQCRAAGVLVVEAVAEPYPAWAAILDEYSTRAWRLPDSSCERRTAHGFVGLVRERPLRAYEFDFGLAPFGDLGRCEILTLAEETSDAPGHGGEGDVRGGGLDGTVSGKRKRE